MTKRLKDPDKKSVYYAEEVAFAGTPFADPLPSDDLLALADELFHSGWWERLSIPVPTIEPTRWWERSSYAEAYCNGSQPTIIRLRHEDINPWYLAHEAAHIAQFYFYPKDRVPDLEGHGREFRACYLNVAETLLGRGAADELRTNFDRRLPVRPEHQPGNPGWILTVPRLKHGVDRPEDATGEGIFPLWRHRQMVKKVTTVADRLAAANPPGVHSIAL